MGSWALNNITAPDFYTDAATLNNLPWPQRINLDVANQAIWWQVSEVDARALYTEARWTGETYMTPGSRTLLRAGLRGIRFRAAIPAAQIPAGTYQAQVTAEAIS
jgi:hypothetical protein